MVTTITIQDETMMQGVTHEFVLAFFTEQITVRDLISRRVQEEVEQYNSQRPEKFIGLIRPSHLEEQLNGARQRQYRPINLGKQIALAEEAFMSNGFLLLVGKQQLTELDEVIELRPDTTVSFLKLVPLVGG